MFLLGYLLGKESARSEHMEEARRISASEYKKTVVQGMVEYFQPFLKQIEGEEVSEVSVPIEATLKFDYDLLPAVFSKLGSKIAHTRLEKEEGKYTLTLYKNHSEAHSRFLVANILLACLWFFYCLILSYPTFLLANYVIDLGLSIISLSFLLHFLVYILAVSVVASVASLLSTISFRWTDLFKEFKHTVRFDEVHIDD
jgi:hypothetical protein